MGKNKKVFPTKNTEKETNKKSFQEQEMKNKEDTKSLKLKNQKK